MRNPDGPQTCQMLAEGYAVQQKSIYPGRTALLAERIFGDPEQHSVKLLSHNA